MAFRQAAAAYRTVSSKMRCPICCVISFTVSRSCLVTAWPLSASTVKLRAGAGVMKNATMVTLERKNLSCSFSAVWERWAQCQASPTRVSTMPRERTNRASPLHPQAKLSINMSMPLLRYSYRPAVKKYSVVSRSKSKWLVGKSGDRSTPFSGLVSTTSVNPRVWRGRVPIKVAANKVVDFFLVARMQVLELMQRSELNNVEAVGQHAICAPIPKLLMELVRMRIRARVTRRCRGQTNPAGV